MSFRDTSFLWRAVIVAGVLLSSALTPPPLLAGAPDGGLQIPNEPTGQFAADGPSGLCQCITDDNKRQTSCLASAVRCRSACGHMYSFVPNASGSCAPAAIASEIAGTPPAATTGSGGTMPPRR